MAETSPPPRRRFVPLPVETTVKKSRKFAVEPVETTTRSSKKADVREMAVPLSKQEPAPPRRRFIPDPVETSFKSSNKKNVHPLPTPELTPVPILSSPPPEDAPKPRRRFTPELIETSKRSKKAGDKRPATLPTDKTDITPGTNHIYVERKKMKVRPPPAPLPPTNTPIGSGADIADLTQIPPFPPRRQGSMRPHPNTRRSTRQNSFQPELDTIASSESEEESDYDGDSTPSLSGSIGSSEDSLQRLQLARTRESCDDRFSGYLLALAAKAAEKQLREQALAAFPNSDFHEIVEHFYDREIEGPSDEDDVEAIGLLPDDSHQRKDTEVGWAMREMQAHQENLNRLREDETNRKVAAEATAPTFRDPFWTNGMTEKNAAFARGIDPGEKKQKEAELERMRSAASPPMLGGDLKFRMCPSPKATKFESDQRHDLNPHRVEDGGGLWGGYCVAEEDGEYLSPATHKGPTMLQTPYSEREDPFSTAFGNECPSSRPPSSPRNKGHMLANLNERLHAEVEKSKREEAILEEFDDKFVTQVYNYLSLGYPALARQYDEELSKISAIDQAELRKDDETKNAKGHIGAPETAKVEGSDDHGPRWKALRRYIFEWARQHPSLGNGAMGPSAWGVRARRGSWAI